MTRIRPAERAFNVISHSSRQPFVCRTCRAQFIRQLHTSPRVLAEEKPFLERIKNSLFGSKKSKEKEAKREESQSKALAKAAAETDTTKLKVKHKRGVKYQIAPVIDPKASYDGYTPAESWNKLEHIGGTEQARKAQDRGEVYRGFMPAKRVQLNEIQMAQLLHHIVVETVALKAAGRDPNEACYSRGKETSSWEHTVNVDIVPREDGSLDLNFKSGDAESSVLKAISHHEPKRKRGVTLPLNDAGKVELGDSSQTPNSGRPWMDMKLRDQDLKLAIVKRLIQLTGARPSDFLISSATTLEDLYSAFKAKEPVKKLAQSDQMKTMNVEVPNVTVHSRKRTLVTKEKAVGRWKLIEEELMNRDLPVTGSRWQGAKPTITAEWKR